MSATAQAYDLNPYCSAFSSYYAVESNSLIGVGVRPKKPCDLAIAAHRDFQEHIRDPDFPCVGAKASLSGNSYRFGFYESISSGDATTGLAHDLWNYAVEQAELNTDYATFAAVFNGPFDMSERTWEKCLWDQLQTLHERDVENSPWDSAVSDDPADPNFSFSFAETGFFIVGLHPGASRLARRFTYPTLIFNVHAQFDRLRERGLFARMRDTIRNRDLKLQGSLNPNLSDFGKDSEVKQYSGRAVEPEWKCPFHRLFGKKLKTKG